MAVGKDTYLESDGAAVYVDLLYTVEGNQLAYIEGWLGVTQEAGDSGDTIAMEVSNREFQFIVPSGLSVSKGDTVYVDTAQVTGHTVDDAGFSTSAGSGKVAAFKATADKNSSTNMVPGKLLAGLFAS